MVQTVPFRIVGMVQKRHKDLLLALNAVSTSLVVYPQVSASSSLDSAAVRLHKTTFEIKPFRPKSELHLLAHAQGRQHQVKNQHKGGLCT